MNISQAYPFFTCMPDIVIDIENFLTFYFFLFSIISFSSFICHTQITELMELNVTKHFAPPLLNPGCATVERYTICKTAKMLQHQRKARITAFSSLCQSTYGKWNIIYPASCLAQASE